MRSAPARDIDRGWDEITRGAEIHIPRLFRFVIRYVTPAFILAVFVGALVQPAEGAWNAAFASLVAGDGWPLALLGCPAASNQDDPRDGRGDLRDDDGETPS